VIRESSLVLLLHDSV